MLRQLIVLFVLFAFNANTNADTKNDPLNDFVSLEVEKLELEQELFGNQTTTEAISIASIFLYEMDEALSFNFDPQQHLPKDFNARVGMNDINWSTIQLVELEEEVELGFDPKAHLPKDFNPFKGMDCKGTLIVYSK